MEKAKIQQVNTTEIAKSLKNIPFCIIYGELETKDGYIIIDLDAWIYNLDNYLEREW